jgi:hypothetical protein
MTDTGNSKVGEIRRFCRLIKDQRIKREGEGETRREDKNYALSRLL